MPFRKFENSITRDKITAIVLQMKIKAKFSYLNSKDILKLKDKKEAALVNAVDSYTLTITCACPNESIERGFILKGMINKGSLGIPYLKHFLQTCNNKRMIKSHHSIIKTKFDSICNKFDKKGTLTDQFQQDIGISIDINYPE